MSVGVVGVEPIPAGLHADRLCVGGGEPAGNGRIVDFDDPWQVGLGGVSDLDYSGLSHGRHWWGSPPGRPGGWRRSHR